MGFFGFFSLEGGDFLGGLFNRLLLTRCESGCDRVGVFRTGAGERKHTGY